MNKNELAFSSALEQAQLIRQGEISPLELVELYLERIEALNPTLGCYYTVAGEMALTTARQQKEQLTHCQDQSQLPPFFGVPTAIKDLNLVEGLPCSYGCAALKENISKYDEAIVTKIKQAGFIIVGKTATSELGSFPYTEPPGFPPTRNPWNPDYTAGGSSGGAAAAVAAGLIPVAHGSDGGGSIRGPAFCCGLVGLKPSRGRVSNAPVGDYQSGISTQGVLSRTVADAAAFLDVIAGYVTGDPYWLPAPDVPFLESTRQPPPQLRIAYSTSLEAFPAPSYAVQEQVVMAVEELEKLGHCLEAIAVDFTPLIQPFTKIWQAGVAASGLPREILSPMNQYLASQQISAGEYLQAVREMQVFSRQIVGLFQNFDILLLPTYLDQGIRIGEWSALPPAVTIEKIAHWIAPCPIANATGLPALNLPTGFSPAGLPLGIQLIAKPASESILIALAAQWEQLRPFSHHLPPLAIL